jgi:hypothetical protein
MKLLEKLVPSLTLPPFSHSDPAFLPNPAVAGAGAKPSINDSVDLFRVVFSWGQWSGFWGGEVFRLEVQEMVRLLIRVATKNSLDNTKKQ